MRNYISNSADRGNMKSLSHIRTMCTLLFQIKIKTFVPTGILERALSDQVSQEKLSHIWQQQQ